jgi:DNA-binding MarR family transcriptional regulator
VDWPANQAISAGRPGGFTLAAVSPDVLHQLGDALNELMLPSNRGRLCAPVIAVAPGIIDGQAYFVLSTLARTGPLTVARLAGHVGIDRSGTSRYADRLQRAGLLERSAGPADRRKSLLGLTPEGARLAGELADVLAGHLRDLTAAWPPGQLQALADGLDRLLAETAGEPGENATP